MIAEDSRLIYDSAGNIVCPMADQCVMGGFTVEDRKSLNVLENELKHIVEGLKEVSDRIARLEASRITSRDLEQTFTEVDELRQKKADKEQMDDHEGRLRILEQKIWMWIGGTMALSALIGILSRIIFK